MSRPLVFINDIRSTRPPPARVASPARSRKAAVPRPEHREPNSNHSEEQPRPLESVVTEEGYYERVGPNNQQSGGFFSASLKGTGVEYQPVRTDNEEIQDRPSVHVTHSSKHVSEIEGQRPSYVASNYVSPPRQISLPRMPSMKNVEWGVDEVEVDVLDEDQQLRDIPESPRWKESRWEEEIQPTAEEKNGDGDIQPEQQRHVYQFVAQDEPSRPEGGEGLDLNNKGRDRTKRPIKLTTSNSKKALQEEYNSIWKRGTRAVSMLISDIGKGIRTQSEPVPILDDDTSGAADVSQGVDADDEDDEEEPVPREVLIPRAVLTRSETDVMDHSTHRRKKSVMMLKNDWRKPSSGAAKEFPLSEWTLPEWNIFEDIDARKSMRQSLFAKNPSDSSFRSFDPNSKTHLVGGENELTLEDAPSALRHLFVFHTPISEFPCSWQEAKDLSTLRTITLGWCKLKRLSIDIGNCQKLEELCILGSNLENLPPQVGYLSELHTFTIFQSKLASVPVQLSKLVNIRNLTLASCDLKEIPEALSSLHKLQFLVLFDNYLTDVPSKFSQLTSLIHLSLSHNCLTEFPNAVLSMSMLQTLAVDNNDISELPLQLSTMRQLSTFRCSNNPLVSPAVVIPADMTDAQEIFSFLDLSSNMESPSNSPRSSRASRRASRSTLSTPPPSNGGRETSISDHKQMKLGILKFNLRPSAGVKYLGREGLLNASSPREVALFLLNCSQLSKSKIGEMLGKNDEFDAAVLKQFAKLVSDQFSGLEIDKALRLFLSTFRLPGEAQMVDRIMNAFAGEYCLANPDMFDSPDTAYVLAFAIIMLHTDAHNPNVKKKMSLQAFIRNVGHIEGVSLSESFLEAVYDRVVSEEMTMEKDDVDIMMYLLPEKKGWLWKLGGRIKTWRRRMFILTEDCLYYFKSEDSKTPLGIVPLEDVAVNPRSKRARSGTFGFALTNPRLGQIKSAKTDESGGLAEGHHEQFCLAAATEEERGEWVDAIVRHVSGMPFRGGGFGGGGGGGGGAGR